MSTSIENVLHAALSGLSLRQQVTANNIANADTPGFKAQSVSFEEQLSQAIQGASNNSTTFAEEAAPVVQENPNLSANANGNSVDMDQQLLLMTDTTMRYDAVAQTLAQRYALYNTILSDEKG